MSGYSFIYDALLRRRMFFEKHSKVVVCIFTFVWYLPFFIAVRKKIKYLLYRRSWPLFRKAIDLNVNGT